VARVANGTRITDDVWAEKRDFVVKVNFLNEYGGWNVCTGMVANDVILTAKHCVTSWDFTRYRITSATSASIFNVVRIEKHPSHNVDVALLWINAPIISSKPMYLSDRELQTGDALAITGFGKTENLGAGTLYESVYGDMSVVACNKGAHIACAASGPSRITGSCGGDSGGPWWRKSSTNHDSIYVVGVNAFGFNGECGEAGKHTGFVRASAIRDWIQSLTDKFTWANEDTPMPTDEVNSWRVLFKDHSGIVDLAYIHFFHVDGSKMTPAAAHESGSYYNDVAQPWGANQAVFDSTGFWGGRQDSNQQVWIGASWAGNEATSVGRIELEFQPSVYIAGAADIEASDGSLWRTVLHNVALEPASSKNIIIIKTEPSTDAPTPTSAPTPTPSTRSPTPTPTSPPVWTQPTWTYSDDERDD